MRLSRLVVAATLPLFASGCARLWSASNVAQMMQTMVDPSARLIWNSVSTTVTVNGTTEKFPDTDREWKELRDAASKLANAGKLLLQENRASGASEWMKQSQSLVDAAANTLRAAEAKSPDQILAAGEQIYNTCVGCHMRYSMMTAPP